MQFTLFILKRHIADSGQNLAYSLNHINATRLYAECRATDSFQNVLLSLLLFQEKTNNAPKRITIISHAFKRRRFIDQHCPILRWPAARVEYIGIDPDKDEAGSRRIETGEETARAQWQQDPWGWGPELGRKRLQRAWDDACLPALQMQDLVKWAGGQSRKEDYPHRLPWEE